MAEKDNRPPTKFLVQRWWAIRQRCADGRVKCIGYAANDPFQSLEGAVAHYRRALEGRWVDPTWEGWGVCADAAVTEIADRDVPTVPMPPGVRAAIDQLSAKLRVGGQPRRVPPQRQPVPERPLDCPRIDETGVSGMVTPDQPF